MTLHSVMELYQRHPSGVIIRAPPYIPHPRLNHHPTHHLPGRLPIPLALMKQPLPPRSAPRTNNSSSPEKPSSSFSIADILNGTIGRSKAHETNHTETVERGEKVVRPWNDCGSRSSRSCSPVDDTVDDEEIDVGEEKPRSQVKSKNSPLDALFQMASKTFEGLNSSGGLLNVDGENGDQNGLFSKSNSSKKRRKSRTAFTNQQIYELEKRFMYQKYLNPADRDEIALQLGLSNAQVITWFQNRRAKLKRDAEELQADVSAAKLVGEESPTLVSRLKEMRAITARHSLLKWDKKHLKVVGSYASAAAFNPLLFAEQRDALLEAAASRDVRLSPEVRSDNNDSFRSDDNTRVTSPAVSADQESVHSIDEPSSKRLRLNSSQNSPSNLAIDYSAGTLRCHSESNCDTTNHIKPELMNRLNEQHNKPEVINSDHTGSESDHDSNDSIDIADDN